MTLRTRILLGFGVVLLVPLVVFGLPIRALMANRLTAEYGRRVASLVGVIRTDLEQESAGIAGRLQALRDAIAGDNGFREAALRGGNRAYLLDYAGNAMRLAGLAMLQIQDDSGRIVSSGHFRNEFDRLEPELKSVFFETRSGPLRVERGRDGNHEMSLPSDPVERFNAPAVMAAAAMSITPIAASVPISSRL